MDARARAGRIEVQYDLQGETAGHRQRGKRAKVTRAGASLLPTVFGDGHLEEVAAMLQTLHALFKSLAHDAPP